jgi:tetratricopeptide (TPR) repeat protein
MPVGYCGACGQASRQDERFCVGCGQPLRQMSPAPAPAVDAARREDHVALERALELLAKKEPAQAIVILERLCGARPEWAVARAYLGVAYLRAARIAEARAELEEAVRQEPQSFICHAKLGEFFSRLGFYDQAVVELDLALALPPADADSRHAAMELRQFAKDKSKGMFYRQTAYPSLSRVLPRWRSTHHAAKPERIS